MRTSLFKNKEAFILTGMKWLELNFLQSGLLHYSERLIKKYFVILRTRGKVEAIAYCKTRRAAILSWLTTVISLDKKVRSSSTSELPKDLRFLKYVDSTSLPFIRLILTSLYISRGIELPPVPNFISITKEPTQSGITEEIGIYLDDFWNALGIRHKHDVPKSVYWRKYHLSTKSGPNGQALWSSICDLSVLPESLITSLCTVGGQKLFSNMSILRKYLHVFIPFFNVSGKCFRKIAPIPDQEGKTREVAIMDYWTQSALAGLHQYLFKRLRSIPQDCTFNQGSFIHKLNKFNDSKDLYYSVDLTTATDRFPISLIRLMLEVRFNKDYANSWYNLMVGYPFKTPTVEINYSVGNPMGALSSWNSFALAHHYVVYYCCRELGINWRDAPYVLLGDDIVIKHDILARKYMSVMTSLGIEFSLQKSHVSPHVFEFAKRIFYHGEEVTPFPIAALLSTRKTPSLMLNVCVNEESKGWNSPLGTPHVLSEFYRLLNFNATFVAKKKELFYKAYQIMMGIRGCITAQQTIRNVMEQYYHDQLNDLKLKEDESSLDDYFQFSFIELFKRSLEYSVSPKSNNKPLGLIAEQLVCLITGRDDTCMDAFDLIKALPVLQVHGQVEETYMSIVKGKFDQFILGLKGDWKFMVKSMTIPISDKVYISRNQELMVHASFTLAKILHEVLTDKRFTKNFFVYRKFVMATSASRK